MKIFEYAKKRNIKSKDVVAKVHEFGFTNVKNHLSLVPLKILDKLDEIPFKEAKIVKKPKTLVFITMEYAPFVSSEVGDMVKNKLKYSSLYGNKNIVILPKYNINKEKLSIFMDIDININHQNKIGKVFKATFEGTDYFFVDSEFYFNRDKIAGFYDDCERFAFFTKAAIKIIKEFDFEIDIINIHDWPLGLFPLLHKSSINNSTQIEFTVYGVTYQGIYGLEVLTDIFELHQKYYQIVEYAGSVNLLKAGIVTADKIDISKVVLEDFKNSYLKKYVYDNM